MRINFVHSYLEAKNITSFWFRPERPLRYIAGQYAEFYLQHDDSDDRGEKRWFTLSSTPGHELVSITTKYAGDEKSSTFKRTLFDMKPGDTLSISEPMGDFVLPKDPHIPLVFVAGGIGITPFHSMFEWLADNHEHRNITFLYGVRSEEEIIFTPTFERTDIHATIVVSEPTDAWGGERGRLSAEMILGLAKPADNALIYMSGPEQMIESLEADMQKAGVDKRQLVTDFFPGYPTV